MRNTIASREHRGNLVRDSKEHVFKDKLVKEEIPKKPGVYALYNDDGLCYIGIAISLKSRILTHSRSKKKKWTNVSWYAIPKMKYVKDVETALIRITHPKYNKQIAKFGKIKKMIVFLGLVLFSIVVKSQTNFVTVKTNGLSSNYEAKPERRNYVFTLKYVNGDLKALKYHGANGVIVLYDNIEYFRSTNSSKIYIGLNENTGEKKVIAIFNDSSIKVKIRIGDDYSYLSWEVLK